MKKIMIFAIIAAFVFACGSSGDETKKAADSSSAKVAEAEKPKIDGGKVYKQYCIACHGLYGDMGASGAHDLTKSVLSLEERVQVITNGRNTMIPHGEMLGEERVKAVAEYTLTLKGSE